MTRVTGPKESIYTLDMSYFNNANGKWTATTDHWSGDLANQVTTNHIRKWIWGGRSGQEGYCFFYDGVPLI